MSITEYGKNFDFESLMTILREAAKGYKVPSVTLIASQGKDPFKVLISTMLSARTKDDATIAASKRLFDVAPTPESLAKLPVNKIEQLIYPVGFYRTKAARVKKAAAWIIEESFGKVPENIEDLLKIEGVGRKTANLVLGEAFRKNAICVDTHVHRISNRLGIITTKTPLETEKDLENILPEEYWITYNTFLVAHGQSICKPISPICSKCAISIYCRKIGVSKSR
jgi:endonuclease-3